MLTTLADARLEAAREAGLAFSGTCSSLGDTAYLADLVLTDVGVDVKFLQHGWIYRPDAAAAADRQRNVATDGFTVATGRLVPTRAWTNAPANAEAYQVFSLIPPIPQAGIPVSWNRAINNALDLMHFTDEMVIGRGTKAGDRRFSLTRGEVVLIAVLAVSGGSNVTITQPTGWSLIRRTNSGTDIAFATYWKRAAATDTEVFTFTLDSSRVAAGGVMAYVDANVSDPVDTDGGTATASSFTATAPAATATVTRGRVLHAFGALGSVVTALPEDDTRRFDAESDDPAGGIEAALSDIELGGSGTVAAATAALGAAAINIGQTIVLQPLSTARDVAAVSRGTTGNNAGGATTLDLPRPSSLPNDDWQPTEDCIRRVVLRDAISGTARDIDQNRNGRSWKPVLINGEVGIELLFAPRQDSMVVVEVVRPYPSLSADTDETPCPLDRLVPMAIWQAYELLNKAAASIGQYKAEVAEWEETASKVDARRRPKSTVLY